MNSILGTIKDGQVLADISASWPDGCRVVIKPQSAALADRVDEEPPTPEEIAEQLALMDRIEPLEMTARVEADWSAARKERKEQEKATFERRADDLKRMWE